MYKVCKWKQWSLSVCVYRSELAELGQVALKVCSVELVPWIISHIIQHALRQRTWVNKDIIILVAPIKYEDIQIFWIAKYCCRCM